MFSGIKPENTLILSTQAFDGGSKIVRCIITAWQSYAYPGLTSVRFQSEDCWCTHLISNQVWTQTGLKQLAHGAAVQVIHRSDLLLPNSFPPVASETSPRSFMRAKGPTAWQVGHETGVGHHFLKSWLGSRTATQYFRTVCTCFLSSH